jgi:hypothetical protein
VGRSSKNVVRNGGNAVNVAVVIVDELQMVKECAEAVHPGKDRALISNPVSLPFSRM